MAYSSDDSSLYSSIYSTVSSLYPPFWFLREPTAKRLLVIAVPYVVISNVTSTGCGVQVLQMSHVQPYLYITPAGETFVQTFTLF